MTVRRSPWGWAVRTTGSALVLGLLAGCSPWRLPQPMPLIGHAALMRSMAQTEVPTDPMEGLPPAGPLDTAEDGVLVPEAPQQTALPQPQVLQRTPSMTLTAVATYRIRARVLHVEHYHWDEGAPLIPVDLALGWQSMSANRLLRHLTVGQWARHYYWTPLLTTFARRNIETQSANTHLIPASPEVRAQMEDVQAGQLVELDGFLVNLDKPDGDYWHSSLTRLDTGEDSCELMYVTRLAWLRRDPVRSTPERLKP